MTGGARSIAFLLAGASLLLLNGCFLKKAAINMIGNSLAESGDTFTSDDDPELIRDAIPFGLKTYESLLRESPKHEGLLLAAASGFTQYAYAFVQDEADRVDPIDLARARELRARARRLYLRGRDYALRGLDARHAGFSRKLGEDPEAALALTRAKDVPYLYWAGAAWAAALSAAKDDLDLVADLPRAEALMRRALELDEGYGEGAIHEFFVTYEGSRPEAMGGSIAKAREHFRRALELSKGRRSSVYLALAETVAVREQNLEEFRSLLHSALAIDPDEVPAQRLGNLIAQRRARWLESRIADLFLQAETGEGAQ